MSTAQTIRTTLVLALACLAAPSVMAGETRPPNAATVFDHVLVFPAGAGDQVIETWRQRASARALAACIDTSGCRVRTVRFHVSAGWQLPMVGVAVEGRTRPLATVPTAETEPDAPVWMQDTSVAVVRAQVAALAGH